MDRRFFLAMLSASTLDPERSLWRPGAKLISIPKPAPPSAAEVISFMLETIRPKLRDLLVLEGWEWEAPPILEN